VPKKIHLALLKPTTKVTNTFVNHKYVQVGPQVEAKDQAPAPEEPAYKTLSRQANRERKQRSVVTRLRIFHDRVPPPKNKAPCDTCATSVCCSAFVIQLTKEEYDSGLYGDNAVELDAVNAANMHGKLSTYSTLSFPLMSHLGGTVHYLEGTIGTPCPFLASDNKCSIYEDRPVVCRTYSCMDDPRITQEHRDGVLPAGSVVLGEAID